MLVKTAILGFGGYIANIHKQRKESTHEKRQLGQMLTS